MSTLRFRQMLLELHFVKKQTPCNGTFFSLLMHNYSQFALTLFLCYAYSMRKTRNDTKTVGKRERETETERKTQREREIDRDRGRHKEHEKCARGICGCACANMSGQQYITFHTCILRP